MRANLMSAFLAVGTFTGMVSAAENGDVETVSRLDQSKLTLIEGIRQAAKTQGAPISAKFEFEDGKFWLSVYIARAGIGPDAEHNTLIEIKGEPNTAAWNPKVEVFEDRKHLTRSAMQLTLLQQSRLGLAAVVEKAAADEKGTPYSAIPALKNGKPVVVVKFATPDGASHSVDVAL